MRPVRISLAAAGYSQWISIDYIESWFGTSVAVIPSEDANLTYSVQFALDSEIPSASSMNVQVTRSGTVATVFDPGPLGLGHGLTTGDSVLILGTGSSVLDSPAAGSVSGTYGQGSLGWTVASTPSPTTYTYAVANAGPTVDLGVTKTARYRVFPHGTLVNLTARATGTINYPVRAVRLYLSSYTAGFADMLILQGIAA